MGIYKSLSGILEVRLTSADISGILHQLSTAGIPIFDVSIKDELSACFRIYRHDYRKVSRVAARKGDRLQLIGKHGIYWTGKRLFRRPVLTWGILLLLFLVLFLPSRVLFVQIEGNEQVPTRLILRAAEESGIRFGASRRKVRSEKVKNTLLSAVPQLQWAGVNTRGCVAVISVRERAAPEKMEETGRVSSIVADRDGIILSVTVTEGNGLCAVGQAVQAGDTLISGFTDCGLCVTATQANGEVIALTRREIRVLTLSETGIRGAQQDTDTKYSLLLGKKRINFYKGSGISDGSCVKMYTEYCLTLPGGFVLPVTLVKETITTCDPQPEAIPEETALAQMTEFASGYLHQQMIAGTITERTEILSDADGIWTMAGVYACTEMIGRVQTEEIGVLP